jgi:16S rRNA (cytosine967-C5)-methyltransferase
MVREIAWRILRGGAPVLMREVDRAARENGLDARDRGLLRRLIGTEVRRRATLRALVAKFATGKPDADVAAHLHVGLVQLFFLDQVPDHAAVGETVGATRETLGPRKAGYVNAVLRAATAARKAGATGDPRRDLALCDRHVAEPVFPDPKEHPLLWMESALSIPAPLAKRWTRRYGEERARALALSALSEPDLSLRAIEPREAVARALDELGLAPRNGEHPAILLLAAEHTERALASELFARGAFQVQGETALRSAELLGARAGERLLDACAAPGGKTSVLAGSGARVVACDSSFERLLRVRNGLERLALASNASLVACDAATALAESAFDGVLLDVPCSNTGVLAQRPEARWRFGPASSRSLQALQERILREGAARVRPGGRLVYSTCSLEPDENHQRVATFLENHADFALEEEIHALPDPRGPAGPVDGGYAARLRRS